jgi:hypothetical protein
MAQPHPKDHDDQPAQADQSDYINRNFALPPDQVEWLRTDAYFNHTSQAALVREGIALRRAARDAGLDPVSIIADWQTKSRAT